MTTTLETPVPTTTHRADDGARANSRVMQLVGGISLAVSPLLFLAGAATSPPQESNSAGDYIDSLGNDPWLTALSANLFHYSWVLAAFGALAAIGLVRGRRGRLLTLVSGLAAAVGSIQFTGLLYSDWMNEATDNLLTHADAVAVFTHVSGSSSITFWMLSAKVLGLLGFPLLFAGLARAGVLSWWLVPLAVLPLVGFAVVGGALGIAIAAVCYAPYYVAGWRLVQRSKLG